MLRALSGSLALLLTSCQQVSGDQPASAPSHAGSASSSAPTRQAPTSGTASSPAKEASTAPARSEISTEPEVAGRLRSIAGLEPKAVEQYLSDLKGFSTRGDRVALCALIEYPIFVHTATDNKKVPTASACEKSYELVFTPHVHDAIAKQSFDALFVSSRGVMIGNGEVWFGAVCDNDQCSGRVEIKIKAINN